jgi:hypothetical protein
MQLRDGRVMNATMLTPGPRLGLAGVLTVFGFAVLGCITLDAAVAGSPTPLTPQPTQEQLIPGLAVGYVYADFDDVEKVVEAVQVKTPSAGTPIATLDNRRGKTGSVLTAKPNKFVGAVIKGLIRFPAAGMYEVVMRTNDGARLLIGDEVLLDDPPPHPDRDTGPASVNITQPGWYPITIYYYQRKDSWVLQVKWSGPGLNSEMAPVGAEYLAHVGG